MRDMPNKNELYFQISEAAKLVGVVPATIRNWEKQGLFMAKRTKSGYRIYSLADIELLKNIEKCSKGENMGINTIRMLYGADSKSMDHLSKAPAHDSVQKEALGQQLKELRLKKGYKIKDVAQAVEISPSYLSKIENNNANVSYTILQKLSDYYGTDILDVQEGREENRLVPKGGGVKWEVDADGLNIESVIAAEPRTLEAMIYTVAPGMGRMIPATHNGEEFMYILEGRITMRVNETAYLLRAGDSFSFLSSDQHSWYNSGESTAYILWVHTPLVRKM